jgi:hypothetical protein
MSFTGIGKMKLPPPDDIRMITGQKRVIGRLDSYFFDSFVPPKSKVRNADSQGRIAGRENGLIQQAVLFGGPLAHGATSS